MTFQDASAMVMEKRNIKMALLRGKNVELSSRLAEIERELELFRIMN